MELSAGLKLSQSGRSSIFQLKKSSNCFRSIYVPSTGYREELVRCKEELEHILDRHIDRCADHAFIKGRNCPTNAEMHLGKQYVLSLDIQDFFDSITRDSLNDLLSEDLMFWVLEDGAPRQGLPTSPLVANIAMIEVDRRIHQLCDAFGDVSFSRYADDITIGFQEPSLRTILQQGVETILGSRGLTLNKQKTRLQNVRNGSIHITGVAIDHQRVRPTRKTMRRIRAAKHQQNTAQIAGLTEWAKCKFPRLTDPARVLEDLESSRTEGNATGRIKKTASRKRDAGRNDSGSIDNASGHKASVNSDGACPSSKDRLAYIKSTAVPAKSVLEQLREDLRQESLKRNTGGGPVRS